MLRAAKGLEDDEEDKADKARMPTENSERHAGFLFRVRSIWNRSIRATRDDSDIMTTEIHGYYLKKPRITSARRYRRYRAPRTAIEPFCASDLVSLLCTLFTDSSSSSLWQRRHSYSSFGLAFVAVNYFSFSYSLPPFTSSSSLHESPY